MENMFDDSPKMLEMLSLELCKHTNYGVCFDYAHAALSNVPCRDWAKTLAPFIKHVHINDNDLITDLHLAVGDGKIDWEEFISLQKEYFSRPFLHPAGIPQYHRQKEQSGCQRFSARFP